MKVQIDKSVIERAIDAIDLFNETAYGHFLVYSDDIGAFNEVEHDLRAALAAQEPAQEAMLHDYPILQQFHTKHALSSMRAPSCFCCGKQTSAARPVAVQHLELPGIVICQECKTASQEPAPAKPLSKKQINELAGFGVDYFDRMDFARAIEAAHGIVGQS